MTEDLKKRIDEMPYRDMLELWRFAPSGHPMISGVAGQYFGDVMRRKREEVGQAAHVAASKSIGWDR